MVMSSVLVECNIVTQSVFVLGPVFFVLLNLIVNNTCSLGCHLLKVCFLYFVPVFQYIG